MEKLKMHSPNFTDENIAKLAELFPGCVTESQNDAGELSKAIDFDLLKQELSKNIVDGPKERYQLNWPGKKEALLTANAPITKTLRPCREESVDFDNTENLFIEGDNLEALKLLQETYLGKVKMIYIDPPYNTGKDFIYADNFAESTNEYLQESGQLDEEGNRLVANTDSNGRFHSDWLSMMYPRLKLAKNLLCIDGVIIISVDDAEQENVKKLCNEIFGEENFIANFLWKKKGTTSNVKDAQVSSQVDYQLCYGKSKLSKIKQRVKSTADRKYSNQDEKGNYRTVVMEKKDSGAYKRDTMKFEILGRTPREGKRWQIGESTARELESKNRFIWDGEKILRKIYDFEDSESYSAQPNLLDSHGTSDSGAKLANTELFNIPELFDNPKPIELIKHFISITTSSNSLIMDFFAGSASTAHAVYEYNLENGMAIKNILVQLQEPTSEKSEAFRSGYFTIAEISKERIRRAGKKIKEESPDARDLDIGFRVLKVDSSNMNEVHYTPDSVSKSDLFNQVEHIKNDRSGEDLLFQVMLDWGVDLSLPIRAESIAGKTVYFVNDDDLVACFEEDIDEALIKALADYEPLRIVFRDDGFISDSVKINAEQIFKQLSPNSDIKVI